MSSRRNAEARRAGGLLLAVVLIASPASPGFHPVAITHIACLQHGEAVHGRALPAEEARATRDADRSALRADLATAAGHDHCGNAALLRWRDVALTAPALVSPVAPVVATAPFATASSVAPASALY